MRLHRPPPRVACAGGRGWAPAHARLSLSPPLVSSASLFFIVLPSALCTSLAACLLVIDPAVFFLCPLSSHPSSCFSSFFFWNTSSSSRAFGSLVQLSWSFVTARFFFFFFFPPLLALDPLLPAARASATIQQTGRARACGAPAVRHRATMAGRQRRRLAVPHQRCGPRPPTAPAGPPPIR